MTTNEKLLERKKWINPGRVVVNLQFIQLWLLFVVDVGEGSACVCGSCSFSNSHQLLLFVILIFIVLPSSFLAGFECMIFQRKSEIDATKQNIDCERSIEKKKKNGTNEEKRRTHSGKWVQFEWKPANKFQDNICVRINSFWTGGLGIKRKLKENWASRSQAKWEKRRWCLSMVESENVLLCESDLRCVYTVPTCGW